MLFGHREDLTKNLIPFMSIVTLNRRMSIVFLFTFRQINEVHVQLAKQSSRPKSQLSDQTMYVILKGVADWFRFMLPLK